jgi:hypothetical protein
VLGDAVPDDAHRDLPITLVAVLAQASRDRGAGGNDGVMHGGVVSIALVANQTNTHTAGDVFLCEAWPSCKILPWLSERS